jgi:hypothetical protein
MGAEVVGGDLRDMQFDLLIPLSPRAFSAQLITRNRADFELIREYLNLSLEVW